MTQLLDTGSLYPDIIVITLELLLLIVFSNILISRLLRTEKVAEEDILGTWKSSCDNIVIQFYRTESQFYEARLVALRQGDQFFTESLVVVKSLKYAKGEFGHGTAFAKEKCRWVNCSAYLKNKNTLVISRTDRCLKSGKPWRRIKSNGV